MREAFKFLYAPTTLCFAAKRAIFFFNATNIHLWDICVWERFHLRNYIRSPHLSAFTLCLFVWLPDAWLQQQPWQRGSWQAGKVRGIAPLCSRPPPPSSPPPGPRTSKTAGCCQAERPISNGPSSTHGPLCAPLSCHASHVHR